ncbi:hypothetical protein GCM10011369_23310 [Neiella marina]|uniref:Uncharacterized protein n=1 Tax=Neiella marina TaxID=508461 RepID=A0A8J2U614_9GAMM|nr:hypothetical protein [Neiella marina]GGA80700.1 hypothetical protein GCM10011369_23310 [Neiella marina]
MFGIEAVLVELLFKLVVALAALAAVRVSLMWFDTVLDVEPFKEWINDASDMAKATYYGMRFIAVCLVVGLALS